MTPSLRALSVALWCAVTLLAAPAVAGVTVTGDAHDLTVEADEATVEDVIVAVAEAVGSTIEPPEDMPAAMITGVYRGNISEVLKSLAPSADFFVAWRDGSVEVHFLAEGERPSVAEAAPAEADPPADRRPPADADRRPPAEMPGKPGGWNAPAAPPRRIY